jgi:hypothetical protein
MAYPKQRGRGPLRRTRGRKPLPPLIQKQRTRHANNLDIILEAVHDPKALLKINDAGDFTNPLLHIFTIGRNLQHLFEEGLEKI